jgi:hypothetical protein
MPSFNIQINKIKLIRKFVIPPPSLNFYKTNY